MTVLFTDRADSHWIPRAPKAMGFLKIISTACDPSRFPRATRHPDARTRRRARSAAIALLTGLLPEPWDLDTFTARLGAHRGKRVSVVLCPMPTELTGVWMATSRSDYIFVNASECSKLRARITIQEIAHIVLGHQASSIAAFSPVFASHEGNTRRDGSDGHDARLVAEAVLDRIHGPATDPGLF